MSVFFEFFFLDINGFIRKATILFTCNGIHNNDNVEIVINTSRNDWISLITWIIKKEKKMIFRGKKGKKNKHTAYRPIIQWMIEIKMKIDMAINCQLGSSRGTPILYYAIETCKLWE